MHIAIISPNNLTDNGGMETATMLLVKELRKRENFVSVFYPDKISPSWNVFTDISFIPNLKDFPNKPDIFHVQQTDQSVRFTYLLKQKYRNIPVITTLHGAFFADPFGYCKLRLSPTEPIRQLLRIIPGKYFEQKSLNASDAIVVPSQYMANNFFPDLMREWYIIPNGIDLTQIQKRSQVMTNVIPTIICPGRIFEERGQINLIEALPAILKEQQVIVRFIGDAEPKYLTRILKRMDKLGIRQYITIGPAIPREKIIDIYRKADVVVFPVLQETFGMAIVECMMCGTPIVAMGVGNIPNLIDNGINGLLVNSPEDLAVAVLLMLKDAELRRKCWQNAPLKAAQFSIERTAEEYEKVYNKVMK